MKRRICSILLVVMIVILSIPVTIKSAGAEEPSQMANLVLFVSFSDTDANYWNDIADATGMNNIGEDINSIYNETGSYRAICVKDYFDIISCGKLELNNMMPQMSDTDYTIVPITLDMPTADYSSANQDYNLISSTLEKLNQSTEILSHITDNLDCDGDGFIDNITFLVASDAVGRESTLYPHKGEIGYAGSVQGVQMNAYNVINYGRLETGRAGLVAHELLHVLGPLDTYVNCDDTSTDCDAAPVGCWDIMASTSHRVQYPLASTRQDLGWITIDEASVSGTYTLTTPQTDSDHYALILKTPYSDTEYFVVEYRKQGTADGSNLTDRMDIFIGGSGIIIYRVNLAASPKSNLTQDYIYVFREGESEETATSTKGKEAYLSKESGRTSYGSSDVTAAAIDGAITYTDGTNSGIVIRNVGSASGNSITFDVDYTIDMTGKSWDVESYQSIPASGGSKLDAIMLDGQLYQSNAKLVDYNGKIYGMISNKNANAELLCYENGAWRSVWIQSQGYSYDVDLEVGSDGLYLVHDWENYTSLKIYRMDASENITDVTGTIVPQGTIANPKITVTSAGMVVAYRDYQNGDAIYAYLKQGNVWQKLDTNGAAGNVFEICGRGNDVYLATVNGSGNYVYRCAVANTDTFVACGNEFSANKATGVDIAVDNSGTPYVVCYDMVNCVVYVKYYQNGTWQQLGMNVCNHAVYYVSARIEQNKMYVAYEGESFSGVKSHEIETAGSTDSGTATTEATTTQTIVIRTLTLNQSKISIQAGNSTSLRATIAPANTTQSKSLTWSSSNTRVATVDQNGRVTGKSAGTSVVTVKTVNGIKASCTVTVTKAYTDTEAFAVRLYEKCLGREPDAGGLAHWNQVLVSKERTGAQVAQGFVFSQEYKNKNTSDEEYVEMLYNVFLNRSSDSAGRAHWLELLDSGLSREYVFRGFAQSTEFANICNSYGISRGTVTLTQARDQNPNLTKYVNRLYTQALGRSGEEDGLNHWCNVIQKKAKTPEQVAESFILSQEFSNKNLSDEEYVKVLYRTFLGREYDQAGLEHWIGELNRGCSREDILHRFAVSQEFKQIQASFGLS